MKKEILSRCAVWNTKYELTHFIMSFLLIFFVIWIVFCRTVSSGRVVIRFCIARARLGLHWITEIKNGNELISMKISIANFAQFYLPVQFSSDSMNRNNLDKRVQVLYSVTVIRTSSMNMVRTRRRHNSDNDAAIGNMGEINDMMSRNWWGDRLTLLWSIVNWVRLQCMQMFASLSGTQTAAWCSTGFLPPTRSIRVERKR